MHRNQSIEGTNRFSVECTNPNPAYRVGQIVCNRDSDLAWLDIHKRVKHNSCMHSPTQAGFHVTLAAEWFDKSGTGRETESERASEHEGLLVSLYSKQYLPVANGRVICSSLTLITQRLLTQAPSRRNNRCRHNGTLNVAAVWSSTINPACLCVPLWL